MKPDPGEPALAVSGLRISIPCGTRQVAVVDRVSFDLAAGEVVGLVGESGCGKSITGAALLGMLPSPEGAVEVQNMQLSGRDVTGLDERGWQRVRGRAISMIFQEPLTALDPVFTIENQLLEVVRRHLKLSRQKARDLASETLSSVGFNDTGRILRSYPHELSGGMRQRVMIAMAMSCRPQVLIADEPTTALDVTTQAQVLTCIRRMAREAGTAVLLITHDLAVVAETCDRAMVMYCGRIVEQGPVKELFARPMHPYTAGLLAALPRLSRGAAVPVQAIPGTVPSPELRPVGCYFNSRCKRVSQRCRTESPDLQSPAGTANPLRPQSADHRFACHHPLEPAVT